MTEPSTYPESAWRVLASRIASILSILLLYRVGDLGALMILLVGVAIYYIPRPAASPAAPPPWIRRLWTISALVVAIAYFAIQIAPPPGSIVPPVLAYGLLLMVAVQLLWDRVRQRGGTQNTAS